MRALQAVDRADVAFLVIDATEGVTAQDQRLAERVDAAGCPIVVLLNKWELLDADERADADAASRAQAPLRRRRDRAQDQRAHGQGRAQAPARAASRRSRRTTRAIPTRKVNEVIRAAQASQPAPHGARVLYATQGAADPPTFTLFANKELPPTYLRYLERRLREAFDLGATPIKLPRPQAPTDEPGRIPSCRRTSRPSSSPTPPSSCAPFVYEFWCEHGHGPNLRAAREGTGLDRRTIIQAYKELQLGIICVVDQDSQNCNVLKFQPFSSFPSQVEVWIDGEFHSFAGCALESVAISRMPPFAGKELTLKSYCACCLGPIDAASATDGVVTPAAASTLVHVSTSPWDWNNNDIVHQCDSMNYVIDAAHAERYERIDQPSGRVAHDRADRDVREGHRRRAHVESTTGRPRRSTRRRSSSV